ncbi:unnamed protein product [Clavelina lepadiformis]|uniref:Uncharacterized protein n=1 Tax=Clavelina lepadiformis TaxID=159417 RepID=A0ABP0FFN5_CLALP
MTIRLKDCGSTLSVFYLNKVSQSELWLYFFLQINLKQCETLFVPYAPAVPSWIEPQSLRMSLQVSSASACLVQSDGQPDGSSLCCRPMDPLTARHFAAGDCTGQRFAFRVVPPRYYFPYLPLSSVPSSTAKLAKVSTEDDFKTKAS